MPDRPDAPATRRNRDAILSVLLEEFATCHDVLEIGSGTGQHAVYFGRHLPHLTWHTSDLAVNHAGILAWIGESGMENVRPPLDLDVLADTLPGRRFDAVFSANTAHIMGFAAVTAMFRLVGEALPEGGSFCLYGPFNIDGRFTSESNERFDRSLRRQDPEMGIRDLADVSQLAGANGMSLARRYAMPANNMVLVFSRGGQA
jgi:cyclopropane fatty-acyl-phospholipid synthase-like methyltransferase